MKIMNSDEFYAKYPQYSNIETLKKADILIMPMLSGSFFPDQMIFRNKSLSTQLDYQYYSDDPNRLICRFKESVDVNTYLELGDIVVGSIALLYSVIHDLQERKRQNEITKPNIIVNIYVTINQNKLVEFPVEGNIDDIEKEAKPFESEYELIKNEKIH
ncbi:MAG: hypothetical protein WAU64_00615 [Methanoregula sp.]